MSIVLCAYEGYCCYHNSRRKKRTTKDKVKYRSSFALAFLFIFIFFPPSSFFFPHPPLSPPLSLLPPDLPDFPNCGKMKRKGNSFTAVYSFRSLHVLHLELSLLFDSLLQLTFKPSSIQSMAESIDSTINQNRLTQHYDRALLFDPEKRHLQNYTDITANLHIKDSSNRLCPRIPSILQTDIPFLFFFCFLYFYWKVYKTLPFNSFTLLSMLLQIPYE